MTWSNRQRAGCAVLRSLRIAGGQRRFGGVACSAASAARCSAATMRFASASSRPISTATTGFRHARAERPQVRKRLIPVAVGKGPASGGDRVSGLLRGLRLARGLRHRVAQTVF